MKKSLVIALLGLCLVTTSYGRDYRYSIGAGIAGKTLNGGGFFDFDTDENYTVAIGNHIGDQWLLRLAYQSFALKNNTGRSTTDTIGTLFDNSAVSFQADRFSVEISRLLFSEDHPLNPFVGLGGGLLVWKAVDPDSNTTYTVRSDKLEKTDFAATELILTFSSGLSYSPSRYWSLSLRGEADYLTGAGAEFESELSSARDRWLLGVSFSLNVLLGSRQNERHWPSYDSWTREPTQPEDETTVRTGRDGDGDGVSDLQDHCPNTESGVIVDKTGCPADSDRDGVPDGLDDCPGTRAEARALVDIHGCPVDADFDGVPDYLDACPNNPVGAEIDSAGCPTDSDHDGVPNGLDDCPYTLIGVAVDRNGCIDLSMFERPMVLNIKYDPGSFEIDPGNKERLRKLAGLLNFVSDIKLEISGYTDNIGTSLANRKLSRKRANRVRDFLVTNGVAPDRMKVLGRGETNFVASNQTAGGRAKNRRIEIIFYH